MSAAWSRLRSARLLARLVVDAWPVLVRGYLHPLAEQVPICRERQVGHPAWCAQGAPKGGCGRPKQASDGTEAIVLTADGSFTADQAEAYALSILRAVRQLDAGLPGTPGGIPAVLHLLRAVPESAA